MLKVSKIAHLLGHRTAIYAICGFDLPHTFLSAAGDGYLVSWNLQNLPNGNLEMQVEGGIFCVDFCAERHWAVVGTIQGGLYWLDLKNKQLIQQNLAHSKGIFGVKFYKNWVFSFGADGCFSVWDIYSRKRLETIKISDKSLRSFDIFEPENQIFIGASDGNLYILNLDTFLLQIVVNQAHSNSIFAVFFDKKNNHLWTGGRDAQLRGWQFNNKVENTHKIAENFQKNDINSAQLSNYIEPFCFAQIPAHLFCINSIAHNQNFNLFATASRDKTVRIWDLEEKKLLKSLNFEKDQGHLRSVNSLFWSGFDNLLISASDDKTLIVWKVDN
jgi:WD40 repeat protein